MSLRFVSLILITTSLISWVSQSAQSKLEIPKLIEGEQIIEHYAYTLSYNEEYEQANWVAYSLNDSKLLNLSTTQAPLQEARTIL